MSIRLSDRELAAIDAAARARGITRTAYIVAALDAAAAPLDWAGAAARAGAARATWARDVLVLSSLDEADSHLAAAINRARRHLASFGATGERRMISISHIRGQK